MCQLTASLLAGTAALLAAAAPALAKPMTERVSVSSAEEEADNSSFAGVGISRTGRFVAFNSLATNLVAQDQNGAQDVFLRDRRKGTTVLVSVSSTGEQGNDLSGGPSVSRDGRFVVFSLQATNLVPGDTNGIFDLFVRALKARTTALVSVARGGQPADGAGGASEISGDGRFVVSSSQATNLVSGDTNGARDVFVRDLKTGVTTLQTKSLSGGPADALSQAGVAISGTGRYVVFATSATNLVPGDTNGFSDIFLRDRRTGRTTLVTVDRTGGPADGNSFGVGGVSDDGTVVAFRSNASDLVEGDDIPESPDVFVRDLKAGTTKRIAPAGTVGNVSADGRYVAFSSGAPELVPGDTNNLEDDFAYDRRTGRITRVNVSAAGEQANDAPPFNDPQISANGNAVAFVSAAGNLVPDDTNGASDVLVRTR
jgi:Tol biopolymer transport system component